MGYDEKGDELGMVEYIDVLKNDDGDEGKKKDFLLKNVGWISLGVFLGVLWV